MPERKWKQVGGSDDSVFLKWEKPGEEVVGTWLGMHEGRQMADGKTGQIGTIETADGKVAFSCTTVLKGRLSQCPEGSEIKVVYNGKQRGKTGTEYKSFGVWIAEDESTDFDPSDTGDDRDIPF